MSKPTIVLIHGWGFDSRVWQTLQTKLNNTNILAIDLPGYGNQRDNKTNWNIESISNDLISRTPEQAIWVGWSLGGLLTLFSALHKPTHINAIMTIATTPCFVEKPNWDCAMSDDNFSTFKQSCENDTETCLKEFRQLVAHSADRQSAKDIRSQVCHANTTTLLSGLEILEKTDLRNELKKIQCPVRHVFAKNDALIPAKAAEQTQLFAAANDTHLISNASHGLLISHADVIAQQLQAIIDVQH